MQIPYRFVKLYANLSAASGKTKSQRHQLRQTTLNRFPPRPTNNIVSRVAPRIQIPYRFVKLYANLSAVGGKTKAQRRERRQATLNRFPRPNRGKRVKSSLHSESDVYASAQDILFPKELLTAKKIMNVCVPEHNEMSGGIFSMFSIARNLRKLKRFHGYEVVVMTVSNYENLTYLRQTNFQNSENVFRFEQILRCQKLQDLYLHIPEYSAEQMDFRLSEAEKQFLHKIKKVHVNLLNQNILLMPDRENFQYLYEFADEVTQSVAHHAYFSQEMADRYGLPSMLLPAYTDLSEYPSTGFDRKSNLIIYSPDEAPHKAACLRKIAEEFPEFELMEIKGITFDRFMDLATECRFSLSFGEGFDGYLAQPIHQGGVSFTVYNEDFFPSDSFTQYPNIFSTPEDMILNLCGEMRRLLSDRKLYEKLNADFCSEYEKLYDLPGYIEQISKLGLKQFELFPSDDSETI